MKITKEIEEFINHNIGMFFSVMESAPCILHAPPHNIAIIDKGKDEESNEKKID